jgi:hypothetical protein
MCDKMTLLLYEQELSPLYPKSKLLPFTSKNIQELSTLFFIDTSMTC